MSDDEGGFQEEAAAETPDQARDEDKVRGVKKEEEKGEEKTEAQLMIEAKQKKHEEEEKERLVELEEQRRIQREKEEEDLRRLKEKQAQRKKEREEEEKKLEEQKAAIEEQRKKEEEQRRQEKEAEKQRKIEEAERKKATAQAAMAGGRNFTIEKLNTGDSTMDKFMNISTAKNEMSLNTGELEALKRKTINDRIKPLSLADLDHKQIKQKAEELWKLIVQLETTMYDLTERSKRQEYDLGVMNERQRQINRQKYIAQGVDPEANTRFPPKVQIVSKYERRVDRRTFGDRKDLFDSTKQKDGDKPEPVRPKGVRRENWIKNKEEEQKRGSRDEVEEEETYSAPAQQSSHQEEVAAEEEEE